MNTFVERINTVFAHITDTEKVQIYKKCRINGIADDKPFRQQVAEVVGLKNTTELSKVCNGTSNPACAQLFRHFIDVPYEWLSGDSDREPLFLLSPVAAFTQFANTVRQSWQQHAPDLRSEHLAPVKHYADSNHLKPGPVNRQSEQVLGQQIGDILGQAVSPDVLTKLKQCRFHRVSFQEVQAFAETGIAHLLFGNSTSMKGMLSFPNKNKRKKKPTAMLPIACAVFPKQLFTEAVDIILAARQHSTTISEQERLDDMIELLWRQQLFLDGSDVQQRPDVCDEFITATGRREWQPLTQLHLRYDPRSNLRWECKKELAWRVRRRIDSGPIRWAPL